MRLLQITQDHPLLTVILPWYESSFPLDERRQVEQIKTLLAYPAMHLCALLVQDQPVGLLIYWQWDELIYIEHFAIDPAQRGKKLGEQALRLLLSRPFAYLVLEVELPHDQISQKRIHFYERQGLILNPYDYVQPPYRPGSAAIPMKLMSSPEIPDLETFYQISEWIKERVYKRFYPIRNDSNPVD